MDSSIHEVLDVGHLKGLVQVKELAISPLGGSRLVIEFQPTLLVIHLGVQEILAWLDDWLNLVHCMHYIPKTSSKYGLHSWLPGWMNDRIYMNEACTLIDYTQLSIST